MDGGGLIWLIETGGAVMATILALSVLTLAVALWKLMSLWRLGAWGGAASRRALALWAEGRRHAALDLLTRRPSARARVTAAAMRTVASGMPPPTAREETARVARATLTQAREGLRVLELVSAIAPLLGLLGTVLGMISAFRVLQDSGAQADTAMLAGGIWEALLTTAAGMAVAIPAGVALAWFDAVIDRMQADMEDLATTVFVRSEL